MAATADHVALVDDIVRLVTARLLDPIAILMQSDDATDPLRTKLRGDAEMWAAQLLGPDDHTARAVAVRLVAALYPGDAPFDPRDDWWQTPLGRTVARRLGHPSRQHVPFSVAAAMLGISRQGVHDLITRQKLHRHPDGGVTTESVQHRLSIRPAADPTHDS
ncbi:hypothetical protein CLV30_104271 [Haloactinopolyspora alba]|uniref:MftR C-terminal domain-containing protein n=1 Tax=Haloactinopolyspora alba TaxID=648780 RepID=A0A2P8E7G8_9ACTN|nr:hypothetical protein [Haloactinopolyspora alba]PSL05401.1 hypothetical protein CLV30_104271 [Haloactinopolyspora alba]